MELIIEPQVLFLDEPTTGLDAHTAVSVMSLLKEWVFLYTLHICIYDLHVVCVHAQKITNQSNNTTVIFSLLPFCLQFLTATHSFLHFRICHFHFLHKDKMIFAWLLRVHTWVSTLAGYLASSTHCLQIPLGHWMPRCGDFFRCTFHRKVACMCIYLYVCVLLMHAHLCFYCLWASPSMPQSWGFCIWLCVYVGRSFIVLLYHSKEVW